MCTVFEGFRFWPLGPVFGIGMMLFALALAGGIFTIVMIVDCLQRRPEQFASPISYRGQNDKLIWLVALIASFWFWFVPSIVYYFVVVRAQKPYGRRPEQDRPARPDVGRPESPEPPRTEPPDKEPPGNE